MKYEVKTTWPDNWDRRFAARFGEYGSVHELTADEVIDAIKTFGRAGIEPAFKTARIDADFALTFYNDYD